MAATRQRRALQTVAAALIAAALVGTTLWAIASSAAADPVARGADNRPGPHARQVETFGTIEEMTAGSEAVIRGTVVSIDEGRAFSRQDGGLQLYDVTVQVDEVLAGTLSERAVVLEIDPIVYPDLVSSKPTWPVVGESTVIFLHRKADAPTKFRPVSSQGAFTLRGSDVLSADTNDALARTLATLSRTDFLQVVASSD